MSFYSLKRLKYWIEELAWLFVIVLFGLVLLALLVFFGVLIAVLILAGFVTQIITFVFPVRPKKKCNTLAEKAETESTKES